MTESPLHITPAAATIGMFDGVHRGHRYLVGEVRRLAREHGLRSLLVTMNRHPREVVTGEPMPLLTTTADKLRLLRELGADEVETLDFTTAMAAMTARDFMREILLRRLGVRLLLMGYNHRFGHDGRTASLADYEAWGRELGITVVAARAMDEGERQVSSSAIRRALVDGDVEGAADMLGRPYQLAGRVVEGSRIGRSLGFPTANIVPVEARQMLPRDGVYAVRVVLDGELCPGMMNVGARPTIDRQRTLEVHVIGFDGDLYGKEIGIQFVHRLRDTMAFASRDDLRRQLEKDKAAVLTL